MTSGEARYISAINVGTLRATTSDDDKYCMIDSGANVTVVPKVKGMTESELCAH